MKKITPEEFFQIVESPPPRCKMLVEQYRATNANANQSRQMLGNLRRQIKETEENLLRNEGACGALSDAIIFAFQETAEDGHSPLPPDNGGNGLPFHPEGRPGPAQEPQ